MIIPMDPDLIAKTWTGTPERGPGSFWAYWNACLEAGVYVRVGPWAAYDQPGVFEFHPDKWPLAQQMLKDGTDAYSATCAMAQAKAQADREMREASNITCMWHRKKLFEGKHSDHTPCIKPPIARSAPTRPAKPVKPQTAS
jgi:hypothetical protein